MYVGANSRRPVVSKPAGRAPRGSQIYIFPRLHTRADLRLTAAIFHGPITPSRPLSVGGRQMSRIAVIAASEISWSSPLLGAHAHLERNDDKLKLICRFPT